MLDGIIIIVLIIFAVSGYRRGLIKTALTLASSILALVLSFIIYPAINSVLQLTPVYDKIFEIISEKIGSISFGGGVQSQGTAIIENITWLPSVLTEQIKNNNNPEMYKLLGISKIDEYVSVYITQILVGLLALLITWIIIKVTLSVVMNLTSGIIEHLPIISTFNKQGGFILGILKGWLTLSIIMIILPILIEIPMLQGLNDYLEASNLVKWLYENNLIIIVYDYFFSYRGKF